MDIDVFTEIKARLTIQEVVTRYGIQIERGRALCPFHADKHPSMTFKNNCFRCWACGESGSMIDFVMKLFGLTALEAAKRLNDDFGLSLTIGAEQDEEGRRKAALDRQKREAERAKVEAFESWVNTTILTLSEYLQKLHKWEKEFAPSSMIEDFSPLFAKAIHEIPMIEWYLDILTYGSFAEKIDFYKTYHKEVERIAREFNNSTESRHAG